MRPPPPLALRVLALILAAWLAVPFAAGLVSLGRADWSGADWTALGHATLLSVVTATVATGLVAVGGVPLGHLLARRDGRLWRLAGVLVQLPLALPPLASGILLLLLLGPETPFGRIGGHGLTDTAAGIVLAQSFVAAPFAVVAARAGFAAVNPALEDVAATLGHRPLAVFRRVSLPLAWPTVVAGLLLTWLRAFGEFGATVMVAYHPETLPVFTYVQFGAAGLPALLPVLVPMLLAAALVPALAAWAARRAPVPAAPHAGPDESEPERVREGGNGAGGSPPADGTGAGRARADDGRADEGRADEGRADEGRADEGRADRGRADRGRADRKPAPTLVLRTRAAAGTFALDLEWRTEARRLAILGASGSGKSLTLRVLAGLHDRAAARVRLGTETLDTLPPERRPVGYVPQDYALLPGVPVHRQIRFAPDHDEAAARAWTARLGLAPLAARAPEALSFGQRQRVALARALARRPSPRLLLLDEPFSALDAPLRRQLRDDTHRFADAIDAVIVLVTHDPDEALLLADEILVLDGGRALQAGPAETVFRRPVDGVTARLLGAAGAARGVIGPRGRIAVGGGIALDAGDDALPPPGTAVSWWVRPEQVALAREDAGAAALPATVLDDTAPVRGGTRPVAVRLGEATLAMLAAPSSPRLAAGDRLPIAIDPRAIQLWH